MNISSLIVHVPALLVAQVRERLNLLTGVEVHAASPEGKLIVTIESDSDSETIATYERVTNTEGVMSSAMVYHQFEPEPGI